MGKREIAQEIVNEQMNKTKEVNPLIYEFKPKEDKKVGDNNLYIGVYDIGTIPQLKNLGKPKGTYVYCYGVHVHSVYDRVRSIYGSYVCQNPAKNKFIDVKKRCKFCETANKIYEVRKKYQGEASYDSMKEDKKFKAISDKARKFLSWVKNPYVVLDIDKLKKDQCDFMQVVAMPSDPNKHIYQLNVNGYKFYEILKKDGAGYSADDDGEYVAVINVTRDNSKGAKRAEYAASILKDPVKIGKDWVDCVINEVPNPFDHLMKFPTDDEWADLCDIMIPSDAEINSYINLESAESSATSSHVPHQGNVGGSVPSKVKFETKQEEAVEEGNPEETSAAEVSPPPQRRRRQVNFETSAE